MKFFHNSSYFSEKHTFNIEHLSKLALPRYKRMKYSPSQTTICPEPLIDTNVGIYIKKYKRSKRFDKIKSKGIRKLSEPKYLKSNSDLENPYVVSRKALNYTATDHIMKLCQPKRVEEEDTEKRKPQPPFPRKSNIDRLAKPRVQRKNDDKNALGDISEVEDTCKWDLYPPPLQYRCIKSMGITKLSQPRKFRDKFFRVENKELFPVSENALKYQITPNLMKMAVAKSVAPSNEKANPFGVSKASQKKLTAKRTKYLEGLAEPPAWKKAVTVEAK